ncbi:AraC family transcriptional regulator [Bernardetia sp. Wsw4-3y2]|uniref:helix-turn-helix domain-containing protein n=1 Tax=Bernardetia sp. Wsw4-3y2 TaxID=3127471 RepID=UPI0030CDCA43
MELKIIHTSATLFIFVSLLLATFLFTVKTENKLGNFFFGLFTILTAINISGFVIYNYLQAYPKIEFLRRTLFLLEMPLFYLYFCSALDSNFKWRPKYLVHSIPFLFIHLISIPTFYLKATEQKIFFLQNNNSSISYFFSVFGEIQWVFYIILMFFLLMKFKKIYLENYTQSDNLTYRWLFQLLLTFSLAHFFVVIKDILSYTEYSKFFLWINILVSIIALIVLCSFVFKALYYPTLFRKIDLNLKSTKEFIQEKKIKQVDKLEENEIIALEEQNQIQDKIGRKNENEVKNNSTSITENSKQNNLEINNQIQKLREYMIEHEPYLEPSLTIQELAKQIQIPVRDLSVLINHHINQHFFDFINEYRIEKAKSILKDSTKNQVTILEILYQVGFNSKSSFNTAFKKYTKTTPSLYRKTPF